MRLTMPILTLALVLGPFLSTVAVEAQPDPPAGPECWPPPCVSTHGCRTIHVRVEGIADAQGWGGHFSPGNLSDGYGGFFPECHLTGDDDPRHAVHLFCYDGYLDPTAQQNRFQLPLGPRREIESVELEVEEKGVGVRVQRRFVHPQSGQSIPYEVRSFFPLRKETGFCSAKELFYQANGVLRERPDRAGSGYLMTVE